MSSLPGDVLLVVLSYLGRKDLKSVRLSSKLLAELASRRIYERIILRPNAASLKRALSVVANPLFAKTVKVVELRAETVFKDAANLVAFTQENHWRDQYRWYGHKSSHVDFHKYFKNRPALTAAEDIYGGMDEEVELRRLFEAMPGLESVERFQDRSQYEDPIKSTFGEQYGLNTTLRSRKFRFRGLLRALAAAPIESLKLHFLRWSDLEIGLGHQGRGLSCYASNQEARARLQGLRHVWRTVNPTFWKSKSFRRVSSSIGSH